MSKKVLFVFIKKQKCLQIRAWKYESIVLNRQELKKSVIRHRRTTLRPILYEGAMRKKNYL
jgi:hypothetical protein